MTALELRLTAALRECVETFEAYMEAGDIRPNEMPTSTLEQAREALDAADRARPARPESATPPEVYLAEAAKMRRRAERNGRRAIEAINSFSWLTLWDEVQVPTRLSVQFARLALLLEEAALFLIAPPAEPRGAELGPALQGLLNFCEELRKSGMPIGRRESELSAARLAKHLDAFAREDALARLREDR